MNIRYALCMRFILISFKNCLFALSREAQYLSSECNALPRDKSTVRLQTANKTKLTQAFIPLGSVKGEPSLLVN